mmetsp:Transcript_122433/g.228839  ORF Transcript_122433/g.228839 Transcript_122433/m.228839 type:complete len:196 (+) Transcript_122433:234-821(+)
MSPGFSGTLVATGVRTGCTTSAQDTLCRTQARADDTDGDAAPALCIVVTAGVNVCSAVAAELRRDTGVANGVTCTTEATAPAAETGAGLARRARALGEAVSGHSLRGSAGQMRSSAISSGDSAKLTAGDKGAAEPRWGLVLLESPTAQCEALLPQLIDGATWGRSGCPPMVLPVDGLESLVAQTNLLCPHLPSSP